jgi:hypothetical protein
MAASRVERVAWRAGAAVLLIAAYWCVSVLDERPNAQQLMSSPLVIWLRPLTGDEEAVHRVIRSSFAIPAGLMLLWPRMALLFAATTGMLVGAGAVRTGGEVLARERTFFGVHQVTSVQNGDWHVLTHGTTTHGVQALRGELRSLPTAYYHPSPPRWLRITP